MKKMIRIMRSLLV